MVSRSHRQSLKRNPSRIDSSDESKNPTALPVGQPSTENDVHDSQILCRDADASNDDEKPSYPEGGTQAWLVVLGAWCAMIPSMGLLNTLAILEAWVASDELPAMETSTIGWIFSCYAFLLYFCGAQVGMSIRSLVNANRAMMLTMSRTHIRRIRYPLSDRARSHWYCGINYVYQRINRSGCLESIWHLTYTDCMQSSGITYSPSAFLVAYRPRCCSIPAFQQ